MRSVGPFELTEAEFEGLRISMIEDERLHASLGGFAGRFPARFAYTSADSITFLRPESRVFDDDRVNQLSKGIELETGESGETAETEAESMIIEKIGRVNGKDRISCSKRKLSV